MIIVSACLAGMNCRYDGSNNLNPEVRQMVKKGMAVPVCPEELGGLFTPREPAEMNGISGEDVLLGRGQVLTESCQEVTEFFIKGAHEVLRIAKSINADIAIMKERSPSCGSCEIYDGSFSGTRKQGCGITTALLRQNGIKVYSEENMKVST